MLNESSPRVGPMMSRLLAVVPWKARGPGWSNAGITAIFEDIHDGGATSLREETVYRDPSDSDGERPYLTAEERLAWTVALAAQDVLAKRFGGRIGEYRRNEDHDPPQPTSP